MKNKEIKKVILWDWNGTIFDDLDISLEAVNLLLDEYNKPRINKEQYYSYLDTPIIKFYSHLFDFDITPFSVLGERFHFHYGILSKYAGLTDGVWETIKQLKELGFGQYIVSASHKDKIIPKAEELGVLEYMDDIIAADDYSASDKIERTLEYFKKREISLDNCLVIGDSLHDLEMAEKMNTGCVLLSTGHEGRQKLLNKGGNVVDRISIEVVLHNLC